MYIYMVARKHCYCNAYKLIRHLAEHSLSLRLRYLKHLGLNLHVMQSPLLKLQLENLLLQIISFFLNYSTIFLNLIIFLGKILL